MSYRQFCNGEKRREKRKKKPGKGGPARPVASRSSVWRTITMDTIMSHTACTVTLFSLQSCRRDWSRVDSRCRLPRALPTLQISLGREVVCTQLLRIRVGEFHSRLQGVHICSLLAQVFRAVTRKLDRQGPWCGSPIPMLAAIQASASPTYPAFTACVIQVVPRACLTSLIQHPSRAPEPRLCTCIKHRRLPSSTAFQVENQTHAWPWWWHSSVRSLHAAAASSDLHQGPIAYLPNRISRRQPGCLLSATCRASFRYGSDSLTRQLGPAKQSWH